MILTKSLKWRLTLRRKEQPDKPLMTPHCGVALVYHAGTIILAGRQSCQWLFRVGNDGYTSGRKEWRGDAESLLDYTAGRSNWTKSDLALVSEILAKQGQIHALDLPLFF